MLPGVRTEAPCTNRGRTKSNKNINEKRDGFKGTRPQHGASATLWGGAGKATTTDRPALPWALRPQDEMYLKLLHKVTDVRAKGTSHGRQGRL